MREDDQEGGIATIWCMISASHRNRAPPPAPLPGDIND